MLSTLLPLLGAALVQAPAAPGVESNAPAGAALADFFDEPDAYLEFRDLRELCEDVGRSGLGELLRLAKPLQELTLRASSDQGAVVLTPFEDLAQSAEVWDVVVRHIIERLRPEELGLEAEDVEAVCAAGGARVSYVFRAGEPWEDEPAAWAMAWSLRPGGADALEADLLPALVELVGGSHSLRLEEDADGAGVARSYLLEGPGLGTSRLVLRDELLAWTPDEEFARILREPTRRAVPDTAFQRARRAAAERGQSLWLWIHAPALVRRLAFVEDDTTRAVLSATGLDEIGDVTIGIDERDGQLASHSEIGRRGPSGLHALVRAAPCDWRSLEALTADTLAVAGMPRSARDVAREIGELALWIDGDAYRNLRQHWRAMECVPLLGEAFAADGLGPEFVLFARPTLSPRPLLYLAAPMGTQLSATYERCDAQADAGELFEGGGVRVERIADGPADFWVARHETFDHIAWTRVDGYLVLAESERAMRAYLSAREAEEPADRAATIAAVKTGLRACLLDEDPRERIGLFFHTRSGALVRRLWPLAQLGLRMKVGEAADSLPDAADLSAAVGESTLVVSEYADRLECHGRGLLAGLALVF